jgi:hypothetical protein
LRNATSTAANRSSATPDQRASRQLRDATSTAANRSSATPEQTAARHLSDATNHRLANTLTSTQFDDHNRLLISRLHPHQVEAPTASQLLYPERHALSSLFLYHHHTGHEFIDAGRNVLEQR